MQKHLVPEHVPAMPLSAYLRRAFPRIPASLLKETLKKRDVRVNGVKSDGQATVRGGDEVTLYMPDKYLTAPLRILYEDEHMLAVEKPAGVPVDGDADSIGADTAGINDSVGSAAASLKETTEDLKYMRDLAEQEAINRFTTAEVKIDMTGMTNRIDSDMDLDGVLNTLTEGFAEALEVAAEGVHE